MREASRSDLPKGSEAQCVTCWRLFRSDYQAELHKSYRKPKTDGCKHPSAVGQMAIERRGLAVWGEPPREAPEIGPRKDA